MNTIKASLLTAILSLGHPQAWASQTNVVQNLNIQLWGILSGGSTTNRGVITTGVATTSIAGPQIIAALGNATGNSFPSPARLVVVTPLGGGSSVIQVRSAKTTVDVSAFFSHQQLSGALSGSQSDTRRVHVVDLDFSIQSFALHDAPNLPSLGLHFNLSGFTSESSSGNLAGIGNLQLQGSGVGDSGGNLLILQGAVSVQGDQLEVVNNPVLPPS